ncbi:extra-large guanine nucleotide-binding protein 1 [Tanacetum coccineum]
MLLAKAITNKSLDAKFTKWPSSAMSRFEEVHKTYVPNMIIGASQADIGVLVISAGIGEFETRFEKIMHKDIPLAGNLEDIYLAATQEYAPMIDTENNGQITFKELKAGLKKVGANLKESKIYDLMQGECKKPSKIISPHLNVPILPDDSNGNTSVLINDCEITKISEVQCAGNLHFWVNDDGSYQEERHKNTRGYMWGKNVKDDEDNVEKLLKVEGWKLFKIYSDGVAMLQLLKLLELSPNLSIKLPHATSTTSRIRNNKRRRHAPGCKHAMVMPGIF